MTGDCEPEQNEINAILTVHLLYSIWNPSCLHLTKRSNSKLNSKTTSKMLPQTMQESNSLLEKCRLPGRIVAALQSLAQNECQKQRLEVIIKFLWGRKVNIAGCSSKNPSNAASTVRAPEQPSRTTKTNPFSIQIMINYTQFIKFSA